MADFELCPDLFHADLRRRQLMFAAFDGVDLRFAQLDGANMSHAAFTRADCHNASFREAGLQEAHLLASELVVVVSDSSRRSNARRRNSRPRSSSEPRLRARR